VSFAAITVCVAFQRIFVVVYFVIDSVRELLNTPSYDGLPHLYLLQALLVLQTSIQMKVQIKVLLKEKS
jgi:hypothetical protein